MPGPLGVLAALAGLALANAAYCGLVSSGRVKGGWYAGCEPGAARCPAGALGSPHARLLGVPPALAGCAFYALFLALTFLRMRGDAPGLLALQLAAALGSAVYCAALLWVLLVRIPRACPACYATHTLNLALMVALLASAA